MSTVFPLAAVGAGSIPPWLILPFALQLLLIAVMPLTSHAIKHLWERYYPHVSIGLGLAVALFFISKIPQGEQAVVHTAMEYVSFISLIGSLFVVTGGIHLKVKGEATPLENVAFLAVGAVVANLIGTTGASMVLIRPWIRMNKIRISAYHIIFFIFVVSNCGGSLTPIGDPPLFLGYLRGVPFFWLFQHVFVEWAFVVGALLSVFFIYDQRSFKKVAPLVRAEIEAPDTFKIEGRRNLVFLAVVVFAVFIPSSVPLLREAVMLAAAIASFRLTPKPIHAANAFSFGPIKEVGFLFIGIFLTMMPALGYIAEHGREFRVEKPLQYYLAAGSLSAVLDNAPTYATFFELAQTAAQSRAPEAFPAAGSPAAEVTAAVLRVSPDLIVALSLGAVFFGAMTYIGNGPNFMVKAIADGAGVKTPDFLGYIVRFSLPVLLPILLAAGWLFL